MKLIRMLVTVRVPDETAAQHARSEVRERIRHNRWHDPFGVVLHSVTPTREASEAARARNAPRRRRNDRSL